MHYSNVLSVTSNQNKPKGPSSPVASGSVRLAASPTAAKAVSTTGWVILLAGWVFMLIIFWRANVLGAFFSFTFLPVFVGFLAVTVQMLEMWIYEVRLEGKVLVVRHWSGTKKWNLSSSSVTVRASSGRVRLTVGAKGSGRRTRIRIVPPYLRYLGALADAIVAAHPGDPAARQTAETLTRMAR